MDAKNPQLEALLKSVQEMINDSPVLSQQPETRDGLMSICEKLNEAGLRQLHDSLQAENKDWKEYFENLKKGEESIITQAKNSTLVIQKEVEKKLQGMEETATQDSDEARAESLLKQL
jgi:hypothetical protein